MLVSQGLVDSPIVTDGHLAEIARQLVSEFRAAGLAEEEISLSFRQLQGCGSERVELRASFRGSVPYYPASVVKAFYLAYYEMLKESGKLEDTPELSRAVKDMITVSSNDATGFVVDSITDTNSGPELSGRKWEKWKKKRNAVNRFFQARGYEGLNANQKTFCEDAYGREQAFRDGGENRNRVASDHVARLFADISRGGIAGATGTQEMLDLFQRDIAPEKPFEEGELEDARLTGKALPEGSRIWSKSGVAYDVRHLAARVVLSSGVDFVLVVFTKGAKAERRIIPRAFELIAQRLRCPAAD